jgi:hypothetical protein
MILMEFVDESHDSENEFKFNDDGTYDFFNHTGEYSFGGDSLTLEINKLTHVFKIKWSDEENFHFTGRHMIKTSSTLTTDRSLNFACTERSSTWDPDNDYEVTYYIDPEVIPWDVDRELLRPKIILLREYLMVDTSENTVEYFVNMNLEHGLPNSRFLIVDHTAAGDWVVHYDRQCHILAFHSANKNQTTYRQFYTNGIGSGVPQWYMSGRPIHVPEELQEFIDMITKKDKKDDSPYKSLLLRTNSS